MKRQISFIIWPILGFVCISCQLLQPIYPYMEAVYYVDGNKKVFQEDTPRGFLKEKYWATFDEIDDGERVLFNFWGCGQDIMLKSDEGAFIDGKKYNNNDNWCDVDLVGTYPLHFETGWFSFHLVDDDIVCYEVSFDTEWSDNETGNAINVAGSLYVYDKYYGKYWGRVYRRFIVPEE